MKRRILNLLIALDQLAWVILTLGNGMPDVSGALSGYAGNVAGQDYNNYYNRLGGIAGMGQSSASALGGVTVDAGQGIANAIQAGGDAQTNGILMQNQLRAQGLGNVATLAGAGLSAYGSSQNAKNSKVTPYSNSYQ